MEDGAVVWEMETEPGIIGFDSWNYAGESSFVSLSLKHHKTVEENYWDFSIGTRIRLFFLLDLLSVDFAFVSQKFQKTLCDHCRQWEWRTSLNYCESWPCDQLSETVMLCHHSLTVADTVATEAGYSLSVWETHNQPTVSVLHITLCKWTQNNLINSSDIWNLLWITFFPPDREQSFSQVKPWCLLDVLGVNCSCNPSFPDQRPSCSVTALLCSVRESFSPKDLPMFLFWSEGWMLWWREGKMLLGLN